MKWFALAIAYTASKIGVTELTRLVGLIRGSMFGWFSGR
jgi:hypothetical protein